MNQTTSIPSVETLAKPDTFLRRLASGTFGAGTMGMVGLASGAFVPVAALLILLMQGPAAQATDVDLFPFLTEVFYLLMSLLVGLVQGVVGLTVGLIIGFVATVMGPRGTAPRRILVGMVLLLIAALASSFYLAAGVVRPIFTAH